MASESIYQHLLMAQRRAVETLKPEARALDYHHVESRFGRRWSGHFSTTTQRNHDQLSREKSQPEAEDIG